MAEVGAVYVSVIPSMRGFAQKVNAGLKGIGDVRVGVQTEVDPERLKQQVRKAAEKSETVVKLDADISDVREKVKAAEKTVDGLKARVAADTPQLRLDIKEAEAKATKIRADLEKLRELDASPEVDLKIAAAEANLGRVESRLAQLNGKVVSPEVRAQTAAAEADLAVLDRQLAELTRTREIHINADADTAAAIGGLTALDAAASRIEGRSPTMQVSADTSGARAALNALDGSLGSTIAKALLLGSVLSTVGVVGAGAGAALGAGMALAAPGLGAAVLGLSGVGEGVKALQKSQEQAGASAGKNAQQQQQAAFTIANAQDRVGQAAQKAGQARADAAKSVQRAEEQSDRSITAAKQQAARAIRSALEQQASAQQRLQRETRNLAREQRTLTSAWEDGRRSLEDLQDQIDGNALDQRQAAFDLADARKALAEAQAGGDADQIARAQLALDRQLETIDQLNKRTQRGLVDNTAAQRAGVAGTDQYQSALERVQSAQERVSDAAAAAGRADFAVNEARIDGANAVRQAEVDGARQIADAREQGRRQIDAADQAQRDAQKALQQALATTAAAAAATSDSTLDAFNKLTPSQQRFARFLAGLDGQFQKLKESAAAGFLPGLQTGIEALVSRAPEINTFVSRVSSAMGSLAEKTGKALASPQWVEFFDWLGKQAGPSLDLFGRIAGGIFRGLAGLLRGFAPLWYEIGGGIADATDAFAKWGDEVAAGKSEGFNRFMEMVREYGPIVVTFLKDLFVVGWKVVEALAPVGAKLLEAADGMLKFLGSMTPDQLQGIAIAIFAIVAAVKALSLALKAKDFLKKLGPLFGKSPKKLGEVTLAKGECIRLCKDECAKCCDDDGPDRKKKNGKGAGATPAGGGKKGGLLRRFGGGALGGLGAGLLGALGFQAADWLLPEAAPGKGSQYNVPRGRIADGAGILRGQGPTADYGYGQVPDLGKGMQFAQGVSNPGLAAPGILAEILTSSKAFEDLKTKISATFSGIGIMASTWWKTFTANLGTWARTAADTVSSWFDSRGLGGWISRTWTTISTNTSTWWTNFTTTLGVWAWTAVDTVASWFDSRGLSGWISKTWDDLSTWVGTWWSTFTTNLGIWAWGAVDTVMSWFDSRGFWGWITKLWDDLGVWLGGWWNWLKISLGIWAWTAVDTVMSWFDSRGFWGWITGLWNNLGLWLGSWWTWFKDSASNWAWSAADTILSWFDSRGLWGWVTRTFTDLGVWLDGFWRGIVDNAARLWAGIKRAVAAPINFVIETVWNNGILQAWNKVADLLPGIEPIGRLNQIAEFARGGFSENHSPQITRAGGPTRIWSEPETGGEAYIPMGRAKRGRSTAILGEVARRFGLTLNGPDQGMMLGRRPTTKLANGGVLHFDQGGLIAFGRRLQSMGYDVAEHPAFGGVGDHGPRSLHYSGNAIDVNKGAGTSPQEQAALSQIVPLARDYGLRTIFMVKDHFNHAHFDTGQGADLRGAAGGGGGLFGFFRDKVAGWFDGLTNKPIDDLRGMMGAPPPQFRALPVDLATTMRDKLRDFLFAKADAAEAVPSGGAGAEQWRGVALEALRRTGQSASLVDRVLQQIQIESSGNPRAINLWDINARRGTPSKGLIQTIDPTFQRWRDRGLPNDPYDPLANIVAGIRYAVATYGGIDRIWPKRMGYDSGGIAAGKGFMFKDVIEPERVLSPRQTAAFEQLAPLLRSLPTRGTSLIGSDTFTTTASTGSGRQVDLHFYDAQFRDPVDADVLAQRIDFHERSGVL